MARNIALTWTPPGGVAGPFHIVCYGNSLTGGWSPSDSYPGALATLRPSDTVVNLGTANQYEDQMRANFVTDVATPYASTPGKTKVCIWWEAVDQYHDHGAITAAQLLAKIQLARDLCHTNGWLFVTGTILANKDPDSTFTSADASFNTLLRANLTGINGFVDFDTNSHLTDPSNTTYFQDGASSVSVHLKIGGTYGAEVAPMFNAALNAMVP